MGLIGEPEYKRHGIGKERNCGVTRARPPPPYMEHGESVEDTNKTKQVGKLVFTWGRLFVVLSRLRSPRFGHQCE